MQQKDEGKNRGQNAAGKLHQSGAHQIAHAFHVAHDARHQRAGAVFVVVGHAQQAHVALHLAAHLRDKPLACLGEQLRQRERGNRLHQHGAEDDGDHLGQQRRVAVRRKNFIEQRLGGVGQHQAGDAVDGHQRQARDQQTFARSDQRANLRPEFFQVRLALGQIRLARACAAAVRRTLRTHAHADTAAAHCAHC